MPTLPLYTPNPPRPNASHQVIAPGGYERWYFDAETAAGDVVVVAAFSLGCPDHPEYKDYLARYRRYLARPTRHQPPVLGEYALISLAAYERGRVIARSARAVASDEFRASAERLGLSGGADAAIGSDDSVELTASGTSLTFRPQFPHAPREVTPPSNVVGAAQYHWVLGSPSCTAEGVIRTPDNRSIPFSGRGYYDYHYATTPMPGFLRGRILDDESATAFHAVIAPRTGPGPLGRGCFANWVETSADGVHESVAELRFDAARYPTAIEVESKRLRLERPIVLEPSGAFDRCIYMVTSSASDSRQERMALCEWY